MTGYQCQAFAETQPDCMRDLVRIMNDLVEDYINDSDSDGSYNSDDIVFTS